MKRFAYDLNNEIPRYIYVIYLIFFSPHFPEKLVIQILPVLAQTGQLMLFSRYDSRRLSFSHDIRHLPTHLLIIIIYEHG